MFSNYYKFMGSLEPEPFVIYCNDPQRAENREFCGNYGEQPDGTIFVGRFGVSLYKLSAVEEILHSSRGKTADDIRSAVEEVLSKKSAS